MALKTWKRRRIGDEDVKAALARHHGNVTKAAANLGLARETLSRWLTRDRQRQAASSAPATSSKARQKPGSRSKAVAFGAWVRRTYQLTRSEEVVLQLAELALAMARDERASDTSRLTAMREFRAAVRELDLPEVLNDGEVENTGSDVRPFPRRAG